jgi:hypothetical protein
MVWGYWGKQGRLVVTGVYGTFALPSRVPQVMSS